MISTAHAMSLYFPEFSSIFLDFIYELLFVAVPCFLLPHNGIAAVVPGLSFSGTAELLSLSLLSCAGKQDNK